MPWRRAARCCGGLQKISAARDGSGGNDSSIHGNDRMEVCVSTLSGDMRVPIAQNRFGLGARAGDGAPGDPQAWLIDQFEAYDPRPSAFGALAGSQEVFAQYREDSAALREMTEAERMEARKALRTRGRDLYRDEVAARAAACLETRTPFVERLVHFWANHFAVSTDKPQVTVMAGTFEREAIRPHVLGRFEDMVLAVEQHPAMLFYLDQVRSIGPDSKRATRAAGNNAPRRPGINENLAREIMELHTLGVRTGYSQQDVTEFALAMTGWTIGGIGGDDDHEEGVFAFRPALHEPGPRTILGKTYKAAGVGQAQAVLRDIAAAEATAMHVAGKLARHFVADDPPRSLVDRLKAVFLDTRGDLPSLYRALVQAPEAWQPQARKFKTPWEWSISALRALGRGPDAADTMAQMANQLGQPVWRPQSPAGYDDVAASWAAPDALVRRVEVAQRLARKTDPGLDARERAEAVLGASLSETTATQIARAESPSTALALLLVSPEFQRR